MAGASAAEAGVTIAIAAKNRHIVNFIILFIFAILSNIHNAFRLTDCQIRNQIQYAVGGVEQ
jgi:hypothetical protein